MAIETPEELFRKLGTRGSAAIQAHRRDEPKDVFGDLPEIKSGVARLVQMEWKSLEGGVLKLQCQGKIDVPHYAEGGIPVRGLSVFESVQVTPDNTDTSFVEATDLMRKMVGTDALDALLPANPTGEDLLRAAKSIQAAVHVKPIYFRFTNKFEENRKGTIDKKTGQPYPGRTWMHWGRAILEYAPLSSSPTPSVSANGTVPSNNGHTTPVSGPLPDPWAGRNNEPPPYGTGSTGNSPDDTYSLNPDSGPDVDDLVARAENLDIKAQDELTGLAAQLGYDDDDVNATAGWEEVGEWVRLGKKKGSQSSPASAPSVGTVVKFLPPDKRSTDPTKRSKRPVDCTVTRVGPSDMTVTSIAHPENKWDVPLDCEYVTFPAPATT